MVFLTHVLCEFYWKGSFKSSGVICCPQLPFSLPDKLSTDRRDGEGFFSTGLVAIALITRLASHWSHYNSNYPSWLSSFVSKLLTWHYAGTCGQHCWLADCIIPCNAHSCGLQITTAHGWWLWFQVIVCEFIATLQYMYVLRQLRWRFCTIVLHCFYELGQ